MYQSNESKFDMLIDVYGRGVEILARLPIQLVGWLRLWVLFVLDFKLCVIAIEQVAVFEVPVPFNELG